MKYYHVAPTSYRQGDDLLSLLQRCNGNHALAERYARWRWPAWRGSYVADGEANLVALYDNLDDAQEHRDIWGGQILEIDGEHLDVRRNFEGFAAVQDFVPASLITLCQ